MMARDRSQYCPICDGHAVPAFVATVLGRYQAGFHQCRECRFLYATDPHWLSEAYSHAMADADTGVLLRNLYNMVRCTATLGLFFDYRPPCVDVGGGHGVFTRLMRDVGFDFLWRDLHAENLFARGFEYRNESGVQLVTAFEVIEHLASPLDFAREALALTDKGALLLTTELFPGDRPAPDWAYYAFESGQHIAFFHPRSLCALARKLNMVLTSHGNWHLLSPRPVSRALFSIAATPMAALFFPWIKLRVVSRTQADHEQLKRG